LLGLNRGRLAARHLFDVWLHLGQGAANAHARVPGSIDELRDDFDPR
jgi:hypothetical protein